MKSGDCTHRIRGVCLRACECRTAGWGVEEGCGMWHRVQEKRVSYIVSYIVSLRCSSTRSVPICAFTSESPPSPLTSNASPATQHQPLGSFALSSPFLSLLPSPLALARPLPTPPLLSIPFSPSFEPVSLCHRKTQPTPQFSRECY